MARFKAFGDLAPYRDALADVLTATPVASRVERVPLAEASGRILAEDVHATLDVPAFDRSAMDGYAVRSAETQDAPVTLPIIVTVHAGDATLALPPGSAAQVATGAEVPAGADAVVRFEDASRAGDAITFLTAASRGQNVSVRGGDVAVGDRVLARGLRLTPSRVGVLSSLGNAAATVFARPRVAVLVTGNEVKAPGSTLGRGEVFDSAGPTVASFCRERGAQVTVLPRAPDERETLAAAIEAACASHDMVITTGGSSVGERDLLREVVTDIGGDVFVHGVAQRPGKPLLAARIRDRLLLGLPGYPASTVVCAHLFLDPVLTRASGRTASPPATMEATLGHDVAKKAGFLLFVPVRLEGGVARSTFKESGALTGLASADGFVTFEAEEDGPILAGTRVRVHPF